MKTDHYNQLIIITGASGAGRTTAINVFEDIGFEITSISELPIIDIESDDIDIVELEIIEEFFEEEIIEDIEELDEVEEEENEQVEIVEESEEEENDNQSVEISLETNRQGVEFVSQDVSSSSQQEQTNNQVVSSNVSFDGSGISNQSTQETQQQKTTKTPSSANEDSNSVLCQRGIKKITTTATVSTW